MINYEGIRDSEHIWLRPLTLTERPEPSLGYGPVLIKLQAVSLNYRDLFVLEGLYNLHQSLPIAPVSDGVGEIIAVGEGVTRVKVGDRVAGIFIQKWLCGRLTEEMLVSSTLGAPLDGMLLEYAVLPEDGVVQVPEHLSNEEATTLPIAALLRLNLRLSNSKP